MSQQDEALKIALSPDYDLRQRLVAVPTAGAIRLKRTFRMGIEDGFPYSKWIRKY